jgi:beta-glucosidase/6-phospho-beta-glucosidase/beta-galactosidase
MQDVHFTDSTLSRLLDPDFFFWAAGIEDTFITAPWPETGRTLDEYELTQHYTHWRDDIDLMSQVGVSHARYGIPWHRINPAPNAWDWKFADDALSRLIESGIQPIVDLVHYGLPAWIEGAYLNPAFPRYMAEYARRAAERYRGRIHLWTPLNEPRITAWYCGKLGWWPPFERGWKGFLRVMLGVCKGIVETVKVIRDTDPENVAVHVDATDLYESADPSLAAEVERRQEIVFLALDFVSGRVDSEHKLYSWLVRNGITEQELEWFRGNAIEIKVVGINLYPLFSRKILKRAPHLRIQMPYASGQIVEQLGRMYHERYRAPVFISETASLGTVQKRSQWLKDSVDTVRAARAEGIPICGYTWWPLFALVTWAYRQGNHPAAYYLKQMGLWDLEAGAGGDMARVRTALVDEYRALTGAGSRAAGALKTHQLIERS